LIGYALLKYQLYKCFAGHKEGPGAGAKLLCCVLANYAGYTMGVSLGIGLAVKFGEAIAGLIGIGIDAADIHYEADDVICNLILN
jgi:hypothetical protein